jgi:hypothetical protein
MSPMGSVEGTSIHSADKDDYAIYSRPKSPDQQMSSLMTTSCPPSAFLTSESHWSPSQKNVKGRTDIYSNDAFTSPKHSVSTTSSTSTTTTTNSTSLFNFASMTSLPPRPPSFRLRSRDNLVSGVGSNSSPSHHHPHYNHHFRDSGHASLGSSDDISSAPPLPPRLSCKLSVRVVRLDCQFELSVLVVCLSCLFELSI